MRLRHLKRPLKNAHSVSSAASFAFSRRPLDGLRDLPSARLDQHGAAVDGGETNTRHAVVARGRPAHDGRDRTVDGLTAVPLVRP